CRVIRGFFFSSRRRHTRWPRDWSSDVCSSDLKVITGDFRGVVDYISRIEPQKQVVYLKKVARKKYDKSTPERKKSSQLKEIMVRSEERRVGKESRSRKSPDQ